MQNNVGQQYQIQQPVTYGQPQVCMQTAQPPVQPTPAYQTNPQSVQVPNYSGVNIQIFNPSVGVPGGAPVYNVNAPQYQTGCYPQEYYTNQWGQATANSGAAGNSLNGNNVSASGVSGYDGSNTSKNNSNTTNTTNTTVVQDAKKTEKRNIVQLTDEYVKNLENYLNSQDKEVRLMGAKEVVARLEEDESRKDDKALTALINKMLQDPYQPVRIMAMAMLDSRCVTGDDYTVKVLQQLQNGTLGYGQDSLQASQILLKMSGQVVQKEFEVKPKKEKS